VDAHERQKQQGQHDHVESKEPSERDAGHVLPSLQAGHGECAEVGKRGRQVRHDRRGPIGELAPGQQVAAQAERQRDEQHGGAREPGELPRFFIAVHEEDREHVAADRDHDEVASHYMHQPEQPAVGNVYHDVLDALEGMVGLGHIVGEEQNAGDDLDDESHERDKPERMEDIEVRRDQVPRQMCSDELTEPDPELDPVFYVFPHGVIL